MEIQWFPGHMAKAQKLLLENLKLVDVVIEIIDARVPVSSKNPEFDRLVSCKPRVFAINKIDLAEKEQSMQWVNWFNQNGFKSSLIDSKNGTGFSNLKQMILDISKEKINRQKAKGILFRPIRVMAIGIPNVGKSSFINKIAGRTCAAVADRPGVTKGKQWIRINKEFQLLDTPGVLWPKFESREIGLNLACIGSIKQQILDQIEVASWLLEKIKTRYGKQLSNRYNIQYADNDTGYDILEYIAASRKYIIAKAELDLLRTATVVLDEFQAGKIGKITLEPLGESLHAK